MIARKVIALALLIVGTATVADTTLSAAPLISPEAYRSATPAQKTALSACLQTTIKKCAAPACGAGAPATVEACMRPYGECVGNAKKMCAVQTLGATSIKR